MCDCGRRWTCVAEVVNMPGLLDVGGAEWERRYWPWPRRLKSHPGDFIIPVTPDWLPKVPSGPAQGETCGLVDVDTEQLVGKGGGHTIPKNLFEEPDDGAVNFNG
jgi:hypothetical protein